MTKNYYLILGVGAEASREEIKAAFRRRALELHPDRSGIESGPFLEVQEAYSVLGDPERRRHYDRRIEPFVSHRRRPQAALEPLVRERSPGEPFRPVEAARGFREVSLAESFEVYRPSFDELFDRFWSNFESFGRPKSETLESLTVEAVVSSEEAQGGGMVRVWMPARRVCSACGGQGAIGPYECWQCGGHGALTTEYPVEVEYPSGITDGCAVRIPLARFGIENFYLIVLFRVTAE
jgi:molecular chaperone DnaJ